MAVVVSKDLQKRREQKFQRELKRSLSEIPSRNIDGFIGKIFNKYHYDSYTPDLFCEIITASKFGIRNPISIAGNWFVFAVLAELINMRILERNDAPLVLDPETNDYICAAWSFSEIYNVNILGRLERLVFDCLGEIKIQDFECLDEISPNLFVDIETRSYGIFIAPRPAMKIAELKSYMSDELGHSGLDLDGAFDIGNVARIKIGRNFDSGDMDYISNFEFVFGTVDKLIKVINDRKKYGVSSHKRNLKSGKIADVRGHSRKLPLKIVYSSDTISSHIVYKVKDAAGILRYIGEGKIDRWKHVNSGASHNVKINEHFFLSGPMSVEIAYEGLTKTESLCVEKLLLAKHSGDGLWNSKDYEPFESDDIRRITDAEIQEFLKGYLG